MSDCGLSCQGLVGGVTGLADNLTKQYQEGKSLGELDYASALQAGAWQGVIAVAAGKTIQVFQKRLKAYYEEYGQQMVDDALNQTLKRINDLAWIDVVAKALPEGAKNKILGWIDAGLSPKKLEQEFENTSNNADLFNKLNNSKGINHQKVLIGEFEDIPGVTSGVYISNSVDDITANFVQTIEGKTFTLYPSQASTCAKNASLSSRSTIELIKDLHDGIQFIKIKAGTNTNSESA